MVTSGLARAFSMRRSVRERFGLLSTAEYTVSRSSANTIGTRCGRPSGSVVASLATRAVVSLAPCTSGVILPNYGTGSSPDGIRRVAEVAEELGFDSLWATEHIIVGPEAVTPFGRLY